MIGVIQRVALGVAVFAALATTSVTAAATAPTPKTALIYGDSLTWESQWKVNTDFQARTGWTEVAHAFPGFALCDFNARLAQDLIDAHPSIVTVETAGNYTRPCMLDANGNQLQQGSAAFLAKYRADMATFFSTATGAGARVVFVVAPPMLDPVWNTAILGLQKVAREVAASYPGVSVSLVPRNAVSAAGIYTATRPCLPTETASDGCSGGQIVIRTTSGTQTGIHFCPTGLPAAYPYSCPTYSSGEFRFGAAEVKTTVVPPAPIRPTVKLTAVAGTEGNPLTFRPSLLYPYSQDLTLCYTTADATATVAAGDYTAASGCIVIPAWQTTAPTITVTTLLDHTIEPFNEKFKLTLTGPTVPITGTNKTVTGTIKTNAT